MTTNDKTETKWTKEPWKSDCRTGCAAIYSGQHRNCLVGIEDSCIFYQKGRGEPDTPGSYMPLTEEQEANFNRAVSCVNFCAGNPDLDAVEICPKGTTEALRRLASSTRKNRLEAVANASSILARANAKGGK